MNADSLFTDREFIIRHIQCMSALRYIYYSGLLVDWAGHHFYRKFQKKKEKLFSVCVLTIAFFGIFRKVLMECLKMKRRLLDYIFFIV